MIDHTAQNFTLPQPDGREEVMPETTWTDVRQMIRNPVNDRCSVDQLHRIVPGSNTKVVEYHLQTCVSVEIFSSREPTCPIPVTDCQFF
jgi:hypothetical protein